MGSCRLLLFEPRRKRRKGGMRERALWRRQARHACPQYLSDRGGRRGEEKAGESAEGEIDGPVLFSLVGRVAGTEVRLQIGRSRLGSLISSPSVANVSFQRSFPPNTFERLLCRLAFSRPAQHHYNPHSGLAPANSRSRKRFLPSFLRSRSRPPLRRGRTCCRRRWR